MCDNLHLDSMKQCETPLNTLFFSAFNVGLLQRGIRQTFKNKTGIAIDYQNVDDLYGIMRMVFINNAGDHYARVNEQVKELNTRVIATAISQIQTGVSQKKISFKKQCEVFTRLTPSKKKQRNNYNLILRTLLKWKTSIPTWFLL